MDLKTYDISKLTKIICCFGGIDVGGSLML